MVKTQLHKQWTTAAAQHKTTDQATTKTAMLGPTKNTVGQIVIPYTKGIGKSIKQVCGKYGIQVHFRGNSTIKQVPMKPKDQETQG